MPLLRNFAGCRAPNAEFLNVLEIQQLENRACLVDARPFSLPQLNCYCFVTNLVLRSHRAPVALAACLILQVVKLFCKYNQ